MSQDGRARLLARLREIDDARRGVEPLAHEPEPVGEMPSSGRAGIGTLLLLAAVTMMLTVALMVAY